LGIKFLKKRRGQSNREQNAAIHNESHHAQSLAFRQHSRGSSVSPENHKITTRASHQRAWDSMKSADLLRSPYDSASEGRQREAYHFRGSELNKPVSEICLGCLNAGDQVLIETAHSSYSFTVIDPRVPSGGLTGGLLGDRAVPAALISLWGDGSDSSLHRRRISAGSRLVFYIESRSSLRTLTTSAVRSLLHRRKAPCGSAAMGRRIVSREHVSSD
jgi:hypothetical protein